MICYLLWTAVQEDSTQHLKHGFWRNFTNFNAKIRCKIKKTPK